MLNRCAYVPPSRGENIVSGVVLFGSCAAALVLAVEVFPWWWLPWTHLVVWVLLGTAAWVLALPVLVTLRLLASRRR